MFESLKNKPSIAKTLDEAMEAIKNVTEPYRSKILAAFKALDEIASQMQDYKKYDAMMDDAASALTALTKIDVRKEGIAPALTVAMRHGTPSQVADAISYAIKWCVADYIKLKTENE